MSEHQHDWHTYNHFWEFCACGDMRKTATGEIEISRAHLEQALAAAQQAQRDAERIVNSLVLAQRVSSEAHQREIEAAEAAADEAIMNLARVSHAEYERGKAEAEAEIARLREALEHAGNGRPDVLAYIGDDGAQCVFCGAFGGNPYDVVDVVADWPHEADCVLVAALEATQPRETN